MTTKTSGFTLIELMIVIAIIGLLSSMVSVSLSYARIKARDARRISDLAQIRTALELYYSDHGTYPPIYNNSNYNINAYYYSFNSSWDELALALRPYISLPKDPINNTCSPWEEPATGGCYSYTYGNVGNGNGVVNGHQTTDEYDLTARLENPLNPHRCEGKNYTFAFGDLRWCGPNIWNGNISAGKYIYEASLK